MVRHLSEMAIKVNDGVTTQIPILRINGDPVDCGRYWLVREVLWCSFNHQYMAYIAEPKHTYSSSREAAYRAFVPLNILVKVESAPPRNTCKV